MSPFPESQAVELLCYSLFILLTNVQSKIKYLMQLQ